MLLKASSGERFVPHNFVLIVTLRSKCLPHCVPHCAPNQIDHGKKNVEMNSGAAIFSVFFSDSIVTLENIATYSWNDCE